MNFQELIEQKKLLIADNKKTVEEIYADRNIMPDRERTFWNPADERNKGYADPADSPLYKERCPKQCGRFDGGNRSCRHHCDRSWYDNHDRNIEKYRQLEAKHIRPLHDKNARLEKEIIVLQEKAKLPLLRQQLLTATSEYHELSPNDPEFRQKQIDQKKSLYEKSVALDALERKHNMFGNLPSVKRDPIIVTPEPITITHPAEIIHKPLTIGSLDFDYTKLAIGGAAIVGILALIIWRFK